MHRRLTPPLALTLLSGLLVLCLSPYVHASSTSLMQRILPLHCIFQTINDGSGTLHYVTPAECGAVIPIPSPAPQQPPSPPTSPSRNAVTIPTEPQYKLSPITARTPVVAQTIYRDSPVWSPLVSSPTYAKTASLSPALQKTTSQANTTTIVTMSVVALVFIVIITLL